MPLQETTPKRAPEDPHLLMLMLAHEPLPLNAVGWAF